MRIPAALALPTPFDEPPSDLPIEQAVLRSIAYADVFEYPLQAAEVHHYLHGVSTILEVTAQALAACSAPGNALRHTDGYYTLPGREGLVEVRRRRAAVARQLWPAAMHYGRLIAGLPFVRMVAVTGSLAWDNVERGADIDYLIVTEPDRLWSCRWLIAALARVARPRGVSICANYIVSTRALVLAERNLYGAYELARMRPIAGLGMYHRLRLANAWAIEYLPSTGEPPSPPHVDMPAAAAWPRRALAWLGETTLRTPLGTLVERLEMKYRIRKRAKQAIEQDEASYGVDWYKEHTSGHRHRTLAAFADRLRHLGAGVP